MYSLGTGNSHSPDFIAWPSPRYFPKPMMMGGAMSFSSSKCSWNSETTGKVDLLDTGESYNLELVDAGGNYGNSSTLSMVPKKDNGMTVQLSGQVQVTLYGLKCKGQATDLSYTIKLVNCN